MPEDPYILLGGFLGALFANAVVLGLFLDPWWLAALPVIALVFMGNLRLITLAVRRDQRW